MNDTEAVFMELVERGEYRIDDQGRIWRGPCRRAEKTGRYKQVMFRDENGKWRYVHVHRVVYLKHNGDIPEGMEINHKDGDKHNNHPDNLECVTRSENGLHACRVLGKNRGEKHGAAKLTAADVREIRQLCRKGVTKRRIAERFEIDPGNVTKIAQRRTWKHV